MWIAMGLCSKYKPLTLEKKCKKGLTAHVHTLMSSPAARHPACVSCTLVERWAIIGATFRYTVAEAIIRVLATTVSAVSAGKPWLPAEQLPGNVCVATNSVAFAPGISAAATEAGSSGL